MDDAVRVFISYSHDSPEHKAWVRSAANDLSQRGLDVVLDQNDLKPGQDIHYFVESAVHSSDFVLLVCTPDYARRANHRRRGVGMETNLITSAIYDGATEKFIALLRGGTHVDAIPSYMRHKLFVDVRDEAGDEAWEELCEHLLAHRPADQIGTLVYEALFPYDPGQIYAEPRLHQLRRFTEFVQTGQTEEGRWFVMRRDPIRDDSALILFQDPEPSGQVR